MQTARPGSAEAGPSFPARPVERDQLRRTQAGDWLTGQPARHRSSFAEHAHVCLTAVFSCDAWDALVAGVRVSLFHAVDLFADFAAHGTSKVLTRPAVCEDAAGSGIAAVTWGGTNSQSTSSDGQECIGSSVCYKGLVNSDHPCAGQPTLLAARMTLSITRVWAMRAPGVWDYTTCHRGGNAFRLVYCIRVCFSSSQVRGNRDTAEGRRMGASLVDRGRSAVPRRGLWLLAFRHL
ncbi:uncharacterized protein LY79DRAFT_143466 [Colletotrichum navitas]|uniref:Uncharacterized protein n=1 Tax=Colletotrichum navitas TaxID=681940 RepID=A0AAD8QBU8_9PEZI|nr:uncharacterized protein LY79DRAFT_143466 [Colletotrichum navitas]KAK1599530.1 hypothetical protein LY79DRAFT_143466 [Colletotrichum navitas]